MVNFVWLRAGKNQKPPRPYNYTKLTKKSPRHRKGKWGRGKLQSTPVTILWLVVSNM